MQGKLSKEGMQWHAVEVSEIVAVPLGDGVVVWGGTIQFPKPLEHEPETGKHTLKMADGRSGEIKIVKIIPETGLAYFVGTIS